MKRVVVQARADASGTVRVVVPLEAADADRDVQITIEPLAPRMTREEWQEFVRSTGGSISDPTFTRHPQGDYERREALP